MICGFATTQASLYGVLGSVPDACAICGGCSGKRPYDSPSFCFPLLITIPPLLRAHLSSHCSSHFVSKLEISSITGVRQSVYNYLLYELGICGLLSVSTGLVQVLVGTELSDVIVCTEIRSVGLKNN